MKQRAAWWGTVATIRSVDLLFLDESGFNLGMARTYGWAPSEERALGAVPNNPGRNLSIVACVGTRGVVAPWMETVSMNGERFLDYVRNTLSPALCPGDVVVMDNVRFHKVAGVAEAIKARGASVLYLPPYSPDYSPIENVWSKTKSIVRALAPRELPAFIRAMRTAFESVIRDDILGWFNHCGYTVNINR